MKICSWQHCLIFDLQVVCDSYAFSRTFFLIVSSDKNQTLLTQPVHLESFRTACKTTAAVDVKFRKLAIGTLAWFGRQYHKHHMTHACQRYDLVYRTSPCYFGFFHTLERTSLWYIWTYVWTLCPFCLILVVAEFDLQFDSKVVFHIWENSIGRDVICNWTCACTLCLCDSVEVCITRLLWLQICLKDAFLLSLGAVRKTTV